MDLIGISYILIIIAILGFVGMIIYSSVIIGKSDLQDIDNWNLKVFTPNTIFLCIFAIGIMVYFIFTEDDGVNIDQFYKYFLPVVSLLSIFFSSLVIINSAGIMYFKGD
jgi:hypothetical protein